MKQHLNEIKRMQQLAGLITEGETKVAFGFKYFTNKDEWQEAMDVVVAKIESLYPNKNIVYVDTEKFQDGEETRYTFGQGMGAINLGSWHTGTWGYKDRGVFYPGAVNLNYLETDLIYPDGSRKD
jgi:hypothetical protein